MRARALADSPSASPCRAVSPEKKAGSDRSGFLRGPFGRGRSAALVQGHHTGTADAEVVLECQTCALDLTPIGAAAQLLHQFVALCQAGGSQRMALGEQSAGGVDDEPATAALCEWSLRSVNGTRSPVPSSVISPRQFPTRAPSGAPVRASRREGGRGVKAKLMVVSSCCELIRGAGSGVSPSAHSAASLSFDDPTREMVYEATWRLNAERRPKAPLGTPVSRRPSPDSYSTTINAGSSINSFTFTRKSTACCPSMMR